MRVASRESRLFCSLGGCDVGCHWCDVRDWDSEAHPIMSIEEIGANIPQKTDIVVVTGGEPLVYHLADFTQTFNKAATELILRPPEPMHSPELGIGFVCLQKIRAAGRNLLCGQRAKMHCYSKHDLNFTRTSSSG